MVKLYFLTLGLVNVHSLSAVEWTLNAAGANIHHITLLLEYRGILSIFLFVCFCYVYPFLSALPIF